MLRVGLLAVVAIACLALSRAALAQRGPNGADGPEPGEPSLGSAAPEDAEGGQGASEAGEGQDDPVDVEELERRVEILAEELERLRSGEPGREVTLDQARALGLAPSAGRHLRAGCRGVDRGLRRDAV